MQGNWTALSEQERARFELIFFVTRTFGVALQELGELGIALATGNPPEDIAQLIKAFEPGSNRAGLDTAVLRYAATLNTDVPSPTPGD